MSSKKWISVGDECYTQKQLEDIIKLNEKYRKTIKQQGKKINTQKKKIQKYKILIHEYNAFNMNPQQTLCGNKEVDAYIITHFLSDVDLYHACLINKMMYSTCQNNKKLKERFDYISNIMNNPTDNIKDIGINVSLYNLEKQVRKASNRVVYQNCKGIILYMNEYDDETVRKIILKGPMVLTKKQFLTIVYDNLPEDIEEIYGDHVYLEGFTKNKNKYYLSLGS